MRHRIFIAINLPEDSKKELISYREKWPELPARWTKKENIHITLVFLGYASDEEAAEVCKAVQEVAQKNQPFSITLNKICYGPPNKIPPRMIWVEGEKSKELRKLQQDLENSLSGRVTFEKETPEGPSTQTLSASAYGAGRSYKPHITLARIKEWEFRRIEPEERLQIDEDISLTFEVSSIEVMESRLKKGGAEYAVLESAQLG